MQTDIEKNKDVELSDIEEDRKDLGITVREKMNKNHCYECEKGFESLHGNNTENGDNSIECEIVKKKIVLDGENMNDIFNKAFVKNMIKTCVNKLDKEYERTSSRKVASVENLSEVILDDYIDKVFNCNSFAVNRIVEVFLV